MTSLPASRFPPSFDDSAWAYGFALFGLTLLCGMAIALLVVNLMEGRTNREISLRLANPVRQPWNEGTTILSLYRFKINCLLSVIIMGAVPDVIFLLSGGEAGHRTIEVLFMVDRVGDGMAVIPFLMFVAT